MVNSYFCKVRNIIFSILLLLSSTAFSQGYYTDQTAPKLDTTATVDEDSDINHKEISDIINKQKIRVNIEVGTTFGTTFGNGSYFGTYISPHLTIPVSKRFSLRTGGYFLNSQAINSNNESSFYNPYNPFSNGLTRTFVYVEGAYRLTENLTITGAVYKEFNVFNKKPAGVNYGDYDYEGVIMGVDYKIGENVFIRGQVEFSNGNSPYNRSSGFGHPGQMDPFRPGF